MLKKRGRRPVVQEEEHQQQQPAEQEEHERQGKQRHKEADVADETTVTLQPGQRVHVHARMELRVLRGRVAVAGYVLGPEHGSMPLCAPLTRAAVQLLGCSSVGDDEACVLLRRVRSQEGALLTPSLFPAGGGRAWLRYADTEREACEAFAPEWTALVDELCAAAAAAQDTLLVLVCGKRGVGKSTFVRFLVNSLLQRPRRAEDGGVWLVDTDPGQPEVGPPGSLSLARVQRPLLGHTFCTDPLQRPFTDVRSYAVPGTAPDASPSCYSRAVAQLAALVRERALGTVVVNTAGWVTGLGLEMLEEMTAAFAPTAVLQLVMDGDAVTPLCAAAARDVALACHLGVEHALSACVSVALGSVCVVLHEGQHVRPQWVLAALHHAVVALLSAPSYAVRAGCHCTSLPDDGLLLGMGVVRGFSADGRHALVQCALAPDVVAAGANVLVRAGHALPAALRSPDGAYWRDAAGVGGLGRAPMTGSKWIIRGGGGGSHQQQPPQQQRGAKQ